MKKFIKNEEYFNEIDSELKAYLLGFFVADGSIITPKNGIKCIGMCLKESDKCVLEWFIQEIAPSNKISFHKKKETGNIQYNIKFAAKKLIENLEELYGIKPDKTNDIEFIFPFERMSENLIHHFIRGYFDGDGTVTERKKGLVPQIGFVSTSKKFLLQISEFIPVKDFRITENQGKNMVYYQLWYSGGNLKDIQLYNYLYNNAKYYLQRKFDRFKENSELTLQLKNGE